MKRRKLYHFKDLVSDRIGFFHYHIVTDSAGNKGVSYLLSAPLTAEQNEKLQRYDNVRFSECSPQYAPEIKHQALILMK